MNDLVGPAADVLVPFLAAGVGATAQGAAEEGGSRLFGLAERVARSIRSRLGAGEPHREATARALERALADGDLAEADLAELVSLASVPGAVSIAIGEINIAGDGRVSSGNSYIVGRDLNA